MGHRRSACLLWEDSQRLLNLSPSSWGLSELLLVHISGGDHMKERAIMAAELYSHAWLVFSSPVFTSALSALVLSALNIQATGSPGFHPDALQMPRTFLSGFPWSSPCRRPAASQGSSTSHTKGAGGADPRPLGYSTLLTACLPERGLVTPRHSTNTDLPQFSSTSLSGEPTLCLSLKIPNK